ncbi:MAG: flagellar export chaperone FliS [Treponema sp.]
MSYNSQALTAYQETNIKTASRGSLIIMLYDEGIKQIKCALEYMTNEKINPGDIEQVHQHIVKTQDIITELMASLNMEEGGEISKNLFAIYSFFNQQLFQANIQKDLKPLVTVKDMMEELRSAWQQVVNSSAAASSDSKPMASGVNIAG